MNLPYPKRRHARLYYATLTALICLVLYSCRKELLTAGSSSASEKALTDRHINLNMLQSAYQRGTGTGSSGLKTNSIDASILARIVGTLNVDWTTYTLTTYPDSTQVVEFAMPDDTTLVLPHQMVAQGKGKYRSKTSAVFLLKNDSLRLSFFMKTVEDRTAAGYQPVLERVHYRQMPQGFTGSVYYFALNRQYLNGYRWKEGQLTRTLSLQTVAPASQPQRQVTASGLKPSLNYVLDCSWVVYDVYRYWYNLNTGELIDVIYEGYYYEIECTLTPETGGGGGVTGDGGTRPPPNPCIPTTPVAVESVRGVVKVLTRNPDDDPGGTGGGGGSNPCIPISIIINNLKDPCLRDVLQKLQNAGLTGKIADIIQDLFGAQDKVNLSFDEFTDSKFGPALTSPPDYRNGMFSDNISLNLAHLKGSSQEFAAIIMVHEILHAYMNYNQSGMSQLKQHQAIAEKYVNDIKNFVQQIYPISDSDAYSVILNGLKDTFKGDIPAYYDTLRNKYNVEDPLTTYELLRQGVIGTKCQ